MIKINRLYSEPQIFAPITFEYGINIIMGEEAESTNKKIGVGKSICIEFINFCLLKRISDSRLNLIPKKYTEITESQIKLDLDFDDKKMTISRSIKNQEQITIFVNGEEKNFDRLDDASDYLGNLYFERFPTSLKRLSFRNLLQPIIRDERSEFKDLIQCHDTKKRIPPDFGPHLFYLNLGLEKYSEIKSLNDNLKKKKDYFTEIKKIVTQNDELKIQDAKAHLNELESEVLKINKSIEGLKNNESFELLQEDLVKLESRLSELRTRQQAIKYEIKQIDSLPKPENINENEISIIFNQFKQGLGDLVEKSLDDLKEFKNKIDGFRSSIVNDRLIALKKELNQLNEVVRKLDNDYSQKISLIDNGEVLRDLKTSIKIFNDKNSELSNLRSLIERYDTAERDKKILEAEKTVLISDFDEELYQKAKIIKSFRETILEIHEKIMGNREAHFEIKTTKNKNVVEFVMRTDDDGSHSTERMKVFIYDISLMLNEYTKQYHPGFLIHDNIFEDDDSIEKSLNFLSGYNEKSPNEFQYIVTLNSDLIELASQNNKLSFNVNDVKRASFTKENRFLGLKYNETK
ncbi:hypothetical protein BAZ12_16780 [Elizabethkingia miricola]|uniref:DUF2326 domain-containing protein n=2 Tax=Bacteroidota TaxID=976 RepID=A0ABD4DHW7_ELIMR|nr:MULTISPECIES: DUF2326 domain-containing protein [Bacteroidota]HLS94822.1 DUF2326 domain-containing protein [Sphingobacterium sp.]KUY15538.1 hypothetical protein ATB95_15685 [Elizabethkingia miricola]MBD1428339.1 DUF2326 domain-containing protein [Sphingobacterium litopenaei]MCL1654865.1 DUF2326 domain-containing protein [Elizabethkingia miricola]MDE5488028.1 DUF2326 domain-containing protein [Elizabethkingia meningoseptica]